MKQPQMKRVAGKGIKIQLAVWKGKGAPVVCVHGLTANCRSWDVVAGSLAPGREVIAVDLRGRGLSDKPKTGYSVDRHCEDLQAMMEDLALPPVALMGHSLGASIALAFAARYPDRVDRLVLVDGAGKLTPTQTQKVFAGIKPSLERLGRVFPSFDDYVGLMKQAPFLKPWSRALTDYFRYEVEEVKGGVRSRASPQAIAEEIAHLMEFDASSYYAKVRCPTLILRAPAGMLRKDDVLLPKAAARKMVGAIATVWLAEVPGTNHYSIMFQKNKTRDRAIANFLEA